jgi:hypothetical protein
MLRFLLLRFLPRRLLPLLLLLEIVRYVRRNGQADAERRRIAAARPVTPSTSDPLA